MATAQGIDPFLKAALPTRILKRHGQSLHRRAPGFPPCDTRAGSHMSCELTRNRRSQTAARVPPSCRNQRAKGRTAMQEACNRTTVVHPFGFIASGGTA
jgi:hypothetical protein